MAVALNGCKQRLGPMPGSGGEPLTERQREVFDYLLSFTIEHLYQPSVREIGEHLGIGSTNGVMVHLKALEKRGWIELRKTANGKGAMARAVRILRKPKLTVTWE